MFLPLTPLYAHPNPKIYQVWYLKVSFITGTIAVFAKASESTLLYTHTTPIILMTYINAHNRLIQTNSHLLISAKSEGQQNCKQHTSDSPN